MRVIAGSAKRLILQAPDDKVRPTTDRTKETLFNIIANEIYGATILDLFAGSGALGIEALSRGASEVCFCDNYKNSIDCIRINLEHTKLIEKARIFKYDYVEALSNFAKEKMKFQVIFLDPPYNKGLQQEAIKLIHQYDLLTDDGIIVVESDLKTDLTQEAWPDYKVYKMKKYKKNKFTFIQKEVD